MDKHTFLSKLAEILDYDGVITENQEVATIDVWDSLGILSVLEFMSEIGVKIEPDDLYTISNISQILELANHKIDN